MRYEFTLPPADTNSLPFYLSKELYKVQQALQQDTLQVQPQYSAPAKPRDGLIVLALSPWNPGSGDGYYGFRAGAWRFLG
jgi:hypothetical protein